MSVIRSVSQNVNTPRITFAANLRPVSDEKANRLRQARAKAGFKSAAAAADAFGWTASAYRHHENGTRSFGLDAAKKYGRAFKVKPGWLLCMDGVDQSPPTDFKASDKLIVGARVAAGVWREDTEGDEVLEIDTPAIVENAKRFGYKVEGRSMDLVYEPGTILDCVSIFTNGVEPQSGDHVIVRRKKPDGLRELTVKEFVTDGEETWLYPRSSQPEFKPTKIGRPDSEALEDDEISVIAFVVGNIPPRSLRLLERLGKVRRL